MLLDPLVGDESVAEIDARIEEQLSLIASIDAQMVDRSAALRSGDLSREDFSGWSVRAMDRRAYAASELVSLRHKRHRLTQDESSLRVEAARLREENSRLRGELSAIRGSGGEEHGDASPEDSDCAAVRQQRYIERLKAEIDSARKTIERLSAERTAAEIADLRAQVAADGERAAELKRSFWRALLDGEEAVIHTERAKRFLDRTKRNVPPKFRDDRCEQQAAHGYPRPRTSAECEAEKKMKDE